MKVLVGQFVIECNENMPQKSDLGVFTLAFGDECVRKMQITEVFDREGIEAIPSIYADASSNGVVKRRAFDYIEACILETAKERLAEIDGVFLHLHGASEVEGLGSGEHHILKALREIVGPYTPIAVVCDPHGNLCREYVEGCTLIRSYRESPHTDAEATIRRTASMLCDLVKNRRNIHAVYRKLPLILGGEQSVSTDEPVKSINVYMDELEKDPRILSASWHVGYLRHDTPVAGCGVVVVPRTGADQEYAEKIADQLAEYVWQRRHEFHYTGTTAEPDEALRMAFACPEGTAFISDSGDNVTSGAGGCNTWLLRQVLDRPDWDKPTLFANICDPKAWAYLDAQPIGTTLPLSLGANYDELSSPVQLTVTVLAKGTLPGWFKESQNDEIHGRNVLVHVEGTCVDISIADTNETMARHRQFIQAGIDWDAYRVIIVKQGYMMPEILAKGSLCVMALTGGATPQNTRMIPFRRIMRPMYPIDDI